MVKLVTKSEILNPVYLDELIEISQETNEPRVLALAENIKNLEVVLAICAVVISGGVMGFLFG